MLKMPLKNLGKFHMGDTFRRIFHGMMILALGSGSARLINLAAIPILTRVYSPEDFGVLAVFSALILLLIPITTLRLVIAIPLPKSDASGFAVLCMCVSLIFITATIVLTALLLARDVLLPLLGAEALLDLWWLIVVGMIAGSLFEVLTMWATRKRDYPVIAKTQVSQAISTEGTKVILAITLPTSIGLMIGQIAGYIVGIYKLVKEFRGVYKLHLKQLRPTLFWATKERYRDIPIYRLPAQVLLVLGTQSPLLFVAATYDSNTTGQMGLALMATALPFSLIGQAVSRSYYGEIAKIGSKNSTELLKVFNASSLLLITIIMAPTIIVITIGPWIFTTAFGDEWLTAGQIAALLGISMAPQFVSSALLRTLDVLEKHKLILFLYTQRIIIIILTFGFTTYFSLPVMNTLMNYVILLSLHYIIQYLVIRSQLTLQKRDTTK